MKESRDGTRTARTSTKSSSADSYPLVLDIDDFKGDFSFDALFGNLVNELLPSYQEEDADSGESHSNITANDLLPNGSSRLPSDAGKSSPMFPEVDALLSLFKNSCTQLIDLRKQIDGKLHNLKKEVSVQDSKHRKTLGELEKGVDGLFNSFARLDSRISSVGQTAAKIGDHLQSADAQRETASQTIELIKYLMEFNSSPGDLMELSPLFSDDSRVAEAASIAQKLTEERTKICKTGKPDNLQDSSSQTANQQNSDVAMSAENGVSSTEDQDVWSAVQERALVQALKTFPTNQRWERVAAAVPGKTVVQCKKKFSLLKESFRNKKSENFPTSKAVSRGSGRRMPNLRARKQSLLSEQKAL